MDITEFTPEVQGQNLNFSSALDAPIRLAFFSGLTLTTPKRKRTTLRKLAEFIPTKTAEHKDDLPMLKLAVMDGGASSGNIKAFTGAMIDYDGAGGVSVEQAADRARKAGVAAQFFTSPNHLPDAPRWRALSPYSREMTYAEHLEQTDRFNGVLGGIADDKVSWRDTQRFYFGQARLRDEKKGGGPAAPLQIVVVDGGFLDRVDGIVPAPRPAGVSERQERPSTGTDLSDLLWTRRYREDSIREALDWIPNDAEKPDGWNGEWKDGQPWDRYNSVLRACWYEGADFETFATWAEQSPKFDRRAAKREWDRNSPRDTSDGGFMTLVKLAAQHGNHVNSTPDLVDDFDDLPPLAPKPVAVTENDPFEDYDPRQDLITYDGYTLDLDTPYLIKGSLDQSTISVMYGASNSGKTFAAIDMAHHIARGAAWREHRVKQASVLYLSMEGGARLMRRVEVLKRLHPGSIPHFVVYPKPLNLRHDDGEGVNRAILLHVHLSRQFPEMPSIVIVDTVARATAGGDENSAQDMTAFVGAVDKIKAATGVHVMLIHHSGKDEARGMRGHSSLLAAIDHELHVQCDHETGNRVIIGGKQRDNARPDGGYHFRLQTMELGTDRDGDKVTSCYCEPCGAPVKPAVDKLTDAQRVTMDVLTQLGTADRDAWRKATMKRNDLCTSPDLDSRKRAFNRAVKDLAAKKLIIETSDGFRLYDPIDDWEEIE